MKDNFFDGNLPETEENGKITCEEVSSIQQKDSENIQSQPCDEVIFDVAHQEKPEEEKAEEVELSEEELKLKRKKKIISHTKKITITAMFSALSFLLYFIGRYCSLPFMFAPWLDFQISELPAILVGYMFGPLWGCAVIAVKCLIKLPMTSSGGTGELCDFILGIVLVLTSSLIYLKKKDKKHALIGLLCGSLLAVIVAVPLNRFVIVPFFSNVMGGLEVIASACSTLYPKINADNFYTYYLLLSVIPFNLLRCLIITGFTFIVYKKLSKVIKKFIAR